MSDGRADGGHGTRSDSAGHGWCSGESLGGLGGANPASELGLEITLRDRQAQNKTLPLRIFKIKPLFTSLFG